jgi:hypothetical protein
MPYDIGNEWVNLGALPSCIVESEVGEHKVIIILFLPSHGKCLFGKPSSFCHLPIDSSIRRPLLLLLALGLLVVILHRYTTKLCSTFREVVDFALYTFKGPPVLHNQTSRESRSPETKQMTAKSIQNLKS